VGEITALRSASASFAPASSLTILVQSTASARSGVRGCSSATSGVRIASRTVCACAAVSHVSRAPSRSQRSRSAPDARPSESSAHLPRTVA
jgi:hypothetical protein